MTAVSAPFGVIPAYHPSGIIRQETLVNGIASGYNTVIWTNSPVKFTTTGTLVVVGTGADVAVGVFQGCEFSFGGKFFVSPYWPANQTYDNDGFMEAYFTQDPNIIYEAQADGSVAQTANWEGINLVDATTGNGSTFSGFSQQRLNHTTTGATAATFQVVGLEDTGKYGPNQWGDAFTVVKVKIASYQGQIA